MSSAIEWLSKLWYIRTAEYFKSVKMHIAPLRKETTWMNLTGVQNGGDKSQTRKNTHRFHTGKVYNLRKLR